MRKIHFDFLVIILFGALFVGLVELSLLEKAAKFSIIFIVIAYFLGQFAVKKFKE